jgi:SAM-dependent methyltransferase
LTTESLDEARERLRPYVEAARGFSGWGFSRYGNARYIGPKHPWDYDARVRQLVLNASNVLDIGTGGGERLSRYLREYKGRAVATEAWHVNAPIAANRLRPLGVEVLFCDDDHIPLASAAFDLILNRHASMDPTDAARLLKPGGTLLTEQITGDHWGELRPFFPRTTTGRGDGYFRWLVALKAAGLTVVDGRKYAAAAAYAGLGDFVFMLCVTPWTIPDFDPLGADLPALLDLERTLLTSEGLVLSQGHSVIEARKPD